MEFVIEKARITDAETIFLLENDTFCESRTLADIANFIESPISVCNVARIGGDIAGYIIIYGDDMISIAVREDCRRSGVGSYLLKSVLSEKSELFLEVRESNAQAISFYKNHGFTSVGIRKKYYPDGENAIIMCNKNNDNMT